MDSCEFPSQTSEQTKVPLACQNFPLTRIFFFANFAFLSAHLNQISMFSDLFFLQHMQDACNLSSKVQTGCFVPVHVFQLIENLLDANCNRSKESVSFRSPENDKIVPRHATAVR